MRPMKLSKIIEAIKARKEREARHPKRLSRITRRLSHINFFIQSATMLFAIIGLGVVLSKLEELAGAGVPEWFVYIMTAAFFYGSARIAFVDADTRAILKAAVRKLLSYNVEDYTPGKLIRRFER